VLNRIRVETLCHATENQKKIRQALGFVLNGVAEPIVTTTRGYHGNPINIFSAEILRRKKCRTLIDSWRARLQHEDLEVLVAEIKNRAEGNKLFLKFDLDAALSGRLALGSDHAISAEISISTFSSSPEKALEEFRGLFAQV